MSHCLFTALTLAVLTTASAAVARPVDMTGLSCTRQTWAGPITWDFYGDVATRSYAEGQGQPQRFSRVGEGAYERYSNSDGEWDAIYYFFDLGEGIHVRMFVRPGLIVRDENPKASWERAIRPFDGTCVKLWERP